MSEIAEEHKRALAKSLRETLRVKMESMYNNSYSYHKVTPIPEDTQKQDTV